MFASNHILGSNYEVSTTFHDGFSSNVKLNQTVKPDELGFGLSEISSLAILPAPLTDEEKERQKFCEQVYCTLHSLIQGYTDIQTFKRDIYNDTGIDAFEMARKYGFHTFTDFLKSDYMQKYINVTKTASGELCYVAADIPKFQHIRKEQIESLKNSTQKKTRREGIFDTRRMRQKMLQVTSINDPAFETYFFPFNDCPPTFSAVSLGRKGKEEMKDITLSVNWNLENTLDSAIYLDHKEEKKDVVLTVDWNMENTLEEIDICGLEDYETNINVGITPPIDICGLEDYETNINVGITPPIDICGLEDYEMNINVGNTPPIDICGLEDYETNANISI